MSSMNALVTGITGQDGAYLAQLLLDKGYEVYGAYRRSSSVNFWRIQELGLIDHPKLHLVEYDLTDPSASVRLIQKVKPREVYNLAAQSYVGVSFDQPIATLDITGKGVVHLLEAIRLIDPTIRFYQASTSEMFGKVVEVPQKETTPFYPRSPYGIAKLYAHWMTVNYQESYGIFATSGILFNHESPLRGKEFVTRKITDAVARISCGLQEVIELGNLDAKRDWGFAKEYVEGMWKILQHSSPESYVLSTGRTVTVRDFTELAFAAAGIELEWQGVKEEEKAYDKKTGELRVRINPLYYRPAEVELLIGDSNKALTELGWQAKTDLETLCKIMVEADIRRVKKGVSY